MVCDRLTEFIDMSKKFGPRWEIIKIKEVARELEWTGTTAASTSEVIAAAFVLGRPCFFPAVYKNFQSERQDAVPVPFAVFDMVAAWDSLDTEWQEYVRQIIKEGWSASCGP